MAAPKKTSQYRVHLSADTPLAHPTMIVDAIDEDAAKQAFCEANGISGSRHAWTIERVEAAAAK